MAKFKRKLNIGPHSFFIGGKRVRCRPGDTVECALADLGSQADNYTEVAQPEVRKHSRLPGFVVVDPASGAVLSGKGDMKKEDAQALAAKLAEGETKKAWEVEKERVLPALVQKSLWLSPASRHSRACMGIPNDLKSLQAALKIKTSEAFNTDGQATGERAQKMQALANVWREWAHRVENNDPFGRLDVNDPNDAEIIERIGHASAALSVLESECVEIERRIKLATKTVDTEADDRKARLRFAGIGKFGKNSLGKRFIEYDGRPVIYKDDGKPYFEDDGMSLADYGELVKQHKQARQARRNEERRAEKIREQQA